MRLAHKFLIVSLLVALTPLLFVGARLERRTDKSLRQASLRAQQTVAERTADSVRNGLDNVGSHLTTAQESLLLDIRDEDGLPAALKTLLNNYPVLEDLFIFTKDGKRTASLSRFDGSPPARFSGWNEVFEGIAQKGYYVSPVEFSEGGYPRLIYVVALRGRDGNAMGYLAARVNLYVLTETLKSLDLGSGGLAYLVDGSGRMIAHSTDRDLFKMKFQLPKDALPEAGTGREYRGRFGEQVLGAKTPVPETDWWLIVEQPSTEAFRLVREMRRYIVVSMLLAALFAGGLALLLSPLIVRPLRQFLAVVQNMKGGQFDSLVTVRSSDELGRIAQALREAQPALEKRVRDSVLGKLARFIGHDMRQPLQALKNSLEMVESHVSGADALAKKHFKICLEMIGFVEEYIEDILTVGRERSPVLRRMDLSMVVRESLQKMKLGPEQVSLSLSPCPALVDPKEVARAFQNAVKNAMEASGPGVKIDVAASRRKDQSVIVVQDEAGGLSPEKSQKLFEEYTTKETGTGLGFLIMKRVMDRHNGVLNVESQSGRGTRVEFLFPALAEEVPALAASS